MFQRKSMEVMDCLHDFVCNSCRAHVVLACKRTYKDMISTRPELLSCHGFLPTIEDTFSRRVVRCPACGFQMSEQEIRESEKDLMEYS